MNVEGQVGVNRAPKFSLLLSIVIFWVVRRKQRTLQLWMCEVAVELFGIFFFGMMGFCILYTYIRFAIHIIYHDIVLFFGLWSCVSVGSRRILKNRYSLSTQSVEITLEKLASQSASVRVKGSP